MKNKNWLFLFSLFLMFSGTMAWAQGNPYGEDQTITNTNDVPTGRINVGVPSAVAIDRDWVNVRQGPGTDYKVLKTFQRGTQGTIIGEKSGWYLIQFNNGTKGWIRGDLVVEKEDVQPTPPPDTGDKSYLAKSFDRWDRHLGNSLLDFKKFPWWWKMHWANSAYQNGDWEKAYNLAMKDTSSPLQARYLMAKCLFQMGKYSEAKRLFKTIEKTLEDAAFLQVMDDFAKPYIEEPVVFKFGGFDSVKEYKEKKAAGNRVGLNSDEYYKKFVDINTWKWKSKGAYNEFQKIGGIDCSGFVQKLQKEAFDQAGVKYPISGRTSASGLAKSQFTKEINPGYKPPPPPDIRPGDMIILDYGHNRYGHSMIYRGKDAAGNIRVLVMGDTAVEGILAPEKVQFYKGTFRMQGMDKVREQLTA